MVRELDRMVAATAQVINTTYFEVAQRVMIVISLVLTYNLMFCPDHHGYELRSDLQHEHGQLQCYQRQRQHRGHPIRVPIPKVLEVSQRATAAKGICFSHS